MFAHYHTGILPDTKNTRVNAGRYREQKSKRQRSVPDFPPMRRMVHFSAHLSADLPYKHT